MSSTQARNDRGYHQDYIARIRYSNTLPPPPIPPKLLEIPNNGFAGGIYTSASFATRLAREQPLNIEADAELGMPIDLVGIPGVFDNDESAITALKNPDIPAKDRLLLRPLASLGKPSTGGAGVSFLRRTEYITSAYQSTSGGAKAEPIRSARSTPHRARKRRFDEDKEAPITIAKNIIKGFNVAHPADAYNGPEDGDPQNIRGAEVTHAERDAWANPRHPRRAEVKLVDAYPLLPDLDAYPPPTDDGPIGFATFKFISNPVAKKGRYDERLDVALLRQKDVSQEEMERHDASLKLWQKDPVNNKRYLPKADFAFYLPDETVNVHNVKRKLDVFDPENDDDALYSEARDGVDDLGLGVAKTSYTYNNIRSYETFHQAGDPENMFEVVALSLHDPDLTESNVGRLRKAAYYYPIMQRCQLRQRVKKHNVITASLSGEDESERIDVFEISIRDADENERAAASEGLAAFDTTLA